MSTNHDDGCDNSDPEERIDELKEQAQRAAKGEIISWESDVLPLEQREQFWRHVVEYETAPLTTEFRQLTDRGLELPDPDAIDNEQLTSKLWEVIRALALMRVYICETDHLSDRELYSLLWHDVLRQETSILPDEPGSAWHVDLLGGCSETDTYLYLKYYADEESRRHWLADFPDYDMPAHENPPYDRDRRLPRPPR